MNVTARRVGLENQVFDFTSMCRKKVVTNVGRYKFIGLGSNTTELVAVDGNMLNNELCHVDINDDPSGIYVGPASYGAFYEEEIGSPASLKVLEAAIERCLLKKIDYEKTLKELNGRQKTKLSNGLYLLEDGDWYSYIVNVSKHTDVVVEIDALSLGVKIETRTDSDHRSISTREVKIGKFKTWTDLVKRVEQYIESNKLLQKFGNIRISLNDYEKERLITGPEVKEFYLKIVELAKQNGFEVSRG